MPRNTHHILHGELFVVKQSSVMIATQTCYVLQQEDEEEEGLIVCNGNHQKPQDGIALVAALKACSKQKDLYGGSRLHVEILKRGLLKENIIIGNTLVNVYAKDGALAKAKQVFDELPVRDVVSWNVLVTGYCQHGHDEEAIRCFEQMQGEGLSPNAVTFLCMVKACGNLGAVQKGKEIHVEIIRLKFLGKDDVLGNALVDMYAKCGALAKAQEVFNELSVRDVVSWTALIAGYAQSGLGEEALSCFERMKCESLSPDAVTFACILKACGSIKAPEKGKETHAEILQGGFPGKSRMVGNALVEMYANGGALAMAQKTFDALSVRDVISWTALIAGYCQHGHGEEALTCFDQMKREGLSPDIVTFVCILKACGSIGAAEKGKQSHAAWGCIEAAEKGRKIHAEVIKAGLMEKASVLGSALVDMYAKCGVFAKAHEVFDELLIRDVVSWTALIAGYAQHGHGEEALDCFQRMQYDGLSPNAVTFACILKACGSLGAAEKGKEVHVEIVRKGLLGKVVVVGNALVDMYAKCGALAKAQEVFDKLTMRNVVSWNALIAGYCQYGHGKKAFNCLKQMKAEGLSPDAVTFTCILKACGSIGAAGKGQTHFETMSTSYGIIPTLKHHTCMLDLFCRWGHFDKAMTMVAKIPFSDYYPVWFTLLGACRKRGNMKLARLAFEHVL